MELATLLCFGLVLPLFAIATAARRMPAEFGQRGRSGQLVLAPIPRAVVRR